MAKATIPHEVQVLRFFESGPLEKAEVVFNIVSEKMRARLQAANRDQDGIAPSSSARKRSSLGNQKTRGVVSAEPSPQV